MVAEMEELQELVTSDGSFPRSVREDRQVVTLQGGARLFVKNGTEEDTEREELSYAVAGAIGAPVPIMYRVSKTQIVLTEVQGERLGRTNFRYSDMTATWEGQLLALLDELISNHDRHDGNWRIVDGKPIGFDHNYAFTRCGAHYKSIFSAELDMSRFDTATRQKVNDALRALQPLFERRKRGIWYEAMMRRWYKLAPECRKKGPFRDARGRFRRAS